MRPSWKPVMIRTAIAAAALLLASCGGAEENSLAAIDNEIAAADIDPAISSAIEDEILVDPALVGQSNPNGVRHPERPLTAPYPSRAGASDPNAPVGSPCGIPFEHGAQWAERMPAEFPTYPGGRVTEAAGADRGDCRARVLTFETGHDWERVLDFYRSAATRAGYDAEHELRAGDHVLGGINARTDGAYLVIVTPEASGSRVAVIVSSGS